jgi:single-strand DNA-binding protein
MASLNKVYLIGNLTRDVEVKYTQSGQAIADMGIACNRKWKDAKTGQMKEEATFINIEVWGKSAENCKSYLAKGRPVFVEARLRLDSWEKDGQRYSRLKVVAERVQFLGTVPGGGAAQGAPSAPEGQGEPGEVEG